MAKERVHAWPTVLAAFGIAFILAVLLAGIAPSSLAYAADEPADAPNADNGTAGGGDGAADNAGGTDNAGNAGGANNTGGGSNDVGDGSITGGDGDNAGNGGSTGDGDATLKPTDSNGLKVDDPDNPDQPEEITVTIVDKSGKVIQTLNLEKGKTITFVDDKDNVLYQCYAEAPTVTAPDAPAKDGYEFTGWLAKVNDKGNGVVTAQYKVKTDPGTTNEVKAVRSTNGVVTTNSPKTGDLISIAVPVGIAAVALIAVVVLLIARRRRS